MKVVGKREMGGWGFTPADSEASDVFISKYKTLIQRRASQ